MLVQQNNRITTIASMIQDAKTEDASTKCNDAMGIEVAIKQIMEKYVELVFAKDVEEEEKQQQIKSRWIGMIKYSLINKDPLDIQVSKLRSSCAQVALKLRSTRYKGPSVISVPCPIIVSWLV